MERGAPRMPGTGLLVTIGVIMVGAVVAAFMLGGTRVTQYEPGTPEAAAQAYVQAVLDDDFASASGHLAPEIQARCDPHRLEWDRYGDSVVATFHDVDVTDGRASIRVRLTTTDLEFDPFLFEDEIETRLVLELRDGDWLIVGTEWPFYECFER